VSEFQLYPEKPALVKPEEKSNWGLTVFTIVLFIAVFLSFYRERADFVFSLVVVLLVHEFGHYFFMKRFLYENVKMLFIPMMGAFVQGSKEVFSQRESILVALSGPIPGIFLGAIGLVLSVYFQWNWLVLISFIFLFVNAVNLLPLDPLDGGQVLKVLLIKQQDWYGLVFSLISSLILIAIGFVLNDWLVIGFGFLMGFRVRAMQVNYKIRQNLVELDVNYHVTYDQLSNRDYHVIKETLIEFRPAAAQYAQNLTDENEQLLVRLVDELLIPPMKRDLGNWAKAFVIIVWLSGIVLPLYLLFTLDLNWYFASL
jgi:Zn-dependent protease